MMFHTTYINRGKFSYMVGGEGGAEYILIGPVTSVTSLAQYNEVLTIMLTVNLSL